MARSRATQASDTPSEMSSEVIDMGIGVNATKTPGRQAHEAVEHDESETPLEKDAMESARRGQERIKQNEGKTPGSQIFTK